MEPDGGEEALGAGLGVEDGRAARALVDHGQVVRSRRVPGVVPGRGRRSVVVVTRIVGKRRRRRTVAGHALATVTVTVTVTGTLAFGGRVFALGGRVFAFGGRVFALGGRVFALGGRHFALGGRLFALGGRLLALLGGCGLLYRSLLGRGDFGGRLAFDRVGHDVAGARREGGAAEEERGEREAGGEPALAPGRVRARAGRGRARPVRSSGRLCVRRLRRGRLVAPDGPEGPAGECEQNERREIAPRLLLVWHQPGAPVSRAPRPPLRRGTSFSIRSASRSAVVLGLSGARTKATFPRKGQLASNPSAGGFSAGLRVPDGAGQIEPNGGAVTPSSSRNSGGLRNRDHAYRPNDKPAFTAHPRADSAFGSFSGQRADVRARSREGR